MNELYQSAHKILVETGIDTNNEELNKTPERFIKSIMEMTSSHRNPINVNKIIKFENNNTNNNIIIIKNIPIKSVCQHHIMPFFGTAIIKYKPDKYILGLSKFNYIVDYFGKKLQSQEKLTNEICNFIYNYLEPKAIFVSTEMKHTCISNRGMNDPNSSTIVYASHGII